MRLPKVARGGARRAGRVGRGACPLLLLLLAGCYSAPRPASQILAEPPGTASNPRPRESPRVDTSVLPAGYWQQSGDRGLASALGKGRRVVITEFDVELVDLQFQPPLPRQLMFKPPPVAIGGVGLALIPGIALELIGPGRRNTRLPEDRHRALAAKLHSVFLDDLRRRGLEVVSNDVLFASPSYAGLPKRRGVSSTPFMVLNPLGSDTGQVMHTRTVAAPGLGVVAPTFGRAAAESRILEETGADAALAVRLRVGLYFGKAALEHRSAIRVTTAAGKTTLRARHSILSDADVTGRTHFVPIVGRVVPVRSDAFGHELAEMLPRFIALTLILPDQSGGEPEAMATAGPPPSGSWARTDSRPDRVAW